MDVLKETKYPETLTQMWNEGRPFINETHSITIIVQYEIWIIEKFVHFQIHIWYII